MGKKEQEEIRARQIREAELRDERIQDLRDEAAERAAEDRELFPEDY